jgi:hypothetical protein
VISRTQRANAERIVALADRFGHLPLNEHGQSIESVLNLSIPCAQLVKAGIVTGVDPDTDEGLTDAAVANLERYCCAAIVRALPLSSYDAGVAYQFVHAADEVGLELPPTHKQVAFEARCGHGRAAA